MKLTDHLKEEESLYIYSSYLRLLKQSLKELKKEDKEEVIQEVESHIYESVKELEGTTTESERLAIAFEKLGDVSEMISPIVADKTMEYASRSMHPVRLLMAFANNSGNRFRQFALLSMFSLFQLLSLLVIGLCIAKFFDPTVGLHIGDGGVFVLGTVDEDSAAKEILGYWIIPISAGMAFGCYWLAHSFLRFMKN